MVTEKNQNQNAMHVVTVVLQIVWIIFYSLWLILCEISKACIPSSYKSTKNINGEIVLVTGGGGGLGRSLALRLAKLGAKIVLWDVNVKALEETVALVKGVGGEAHSYKCNLCDKEDVYRVAKKTQQEVGDVSILINNAGVFSDRALLDTPDDLIKTTFDVNIIAHFWTVKAFLPEMIKKDYGHIVTIASLAGRIAVPKMTDYAASKYAAVGFDEALKAELEEMGVKGVKTTVVCPYFIRQTGMFDSVDSKIFPRLTAGDVADKVVEGLVRGKDVVVVPGYMKWSVALKSFMPWSVVWFFIKSMLPDASPGHQSKPIIQVKESQKNE